jgi:GTPase Era involved in 16S rRNA processing
VTAISLSLISHTNAGKTTLARTLLARDVGEVRDAPHVTEFSEDYPLVRSAEGDELTLWDTPGFGDSVRLVKRLKGSKNPLGWFLSEVWDRFRDRAFHATQQAMRNVRDRADVVLYLVNASESPQAAVYIDSEMSLLEWMNKPVIVLLNQLGNPRDAQADAREVELWQSHLKSYPHVANVMPLDAFSRCWVQEGLLLHAVTAVLPDGESRAAMQRLRHAWEQQRMVTFDAAMAELSQTLAAIAVMREALPESAGVKGALRQIGSAVGGLWRQAASAVSSPSSSASGDEEPATKLPAETEAARKALAQRANDAVRQSTGRLIALHGLDGKAQSEIDALISSHFEMQLHLNEGKAAMVGGAVTGALGGLVADVGSAGMTLGGGMLAGAVLGALAAAGAAHGVNVMRGRKASWLTWSAPAMDAMVEAAVLRYLAVAHYGRGRGAWTQGDTPAHWRQRVVDALADHRASLAALWGQRSAGDAASGAGEGVLDARLLQPVVSQATLKVLDALYPKAIEASAQGAMATTAHAS